MRLVFLLGSFYCPCFCFIFTWDGGRIGVGDKASGSTPTYESLFLGLISSGSEVYGIMPLLSPSVLLLVTFGSSLNQAGQEDIYVSNSTKCQHVLSENSWRILVSCGGKKEGGPALSDTREHSLVAGTEREMLDTGTHWSCCSNKH